MKSCCLLLQATFPANPLSKYGLGIATHAPSPSRIPLPISRSLLFLSDGKPDDLDLYEDRYGIEGTRKNIQEARDLDVRPFCVTIDW